MTALNISKLMKNRVLNSIETPNGDRCVDLFIRPDGSFGFEMYRSDTETLTGWFPIGSYINTSFPTEDAAHHAASAVAPWLPTEKP